MCWWSKQLHCALWALEIISAISNSNIAPGWFYYFPNPPPAAPSKIFEDFAGSAFALCKRLKQTQSCKRDSVCLTPETVKASVVADLGNCGCQNLEVCGLQDRNKSGLRLRAGAGSGPRKSKRL